MAQPGISSSNEESHIPFNQQLDEIERLILNNRAHQLSKLQQQQNSMKGGKMNGKMMMTRSMNPMMVSPSMAPPRGSGHSAPMAAPLLGQNAPMSLAVAGGKYHHHLSSVSATSSFESLASNTCPSPKVEAVLSPRFDPFSNAAREKQSIPLTKNSSNVSDFNLGGGNVEGIMHNDKSYGVKSIWGNDMSVWG